MSVYACITVHKPVYKNNPQLYSLLVNSGYGRLVPRKTHSTNRPACFRLTQIEMVSDGIPGMPQKTCHDIRKGKERKIIKENDMKYQRYYYNRDPVAFIYNNSYRTFIILTDRSFYSASYNEWSFRVIVKGDVSSGKTNGNFICQGKQQSKACSACPLFSFTVKKFPLALFFFKYVSLKTK